MTKWISERKLLFTPKGGIERKELVILIGQPYLLKDSDVGFPTHEGAAGCSVKFDGPDGGYIDGVYGADLFQALQLAVDIEPVLKRLSKSTIYIFWMVSRTSIQMQRAD